METVRKILAIIIGVIILVLVILAAKWTGERIRERFFAKPRTVVVELPKTPSNSTTGLSLDDKTATFSAIPETGPEAFGLVLLGSSLFGGLATMIASRKKV